MRKADFEDLLTEVADLNSEATCILTIGMERRGGQPPTLKQAYRLRAIKQKQNEVWDLVLKELSKP